MIADGIKHRSSSRPVDDVLASLLSFLQSKAISVFAVIDHSGEAAKLGIEMPNTKLVIFGSPRAGTPVMLLSPDSALDLPLKILIAQQPDGSARLSYNSTDYLQSRYDLPASLVEKLSVIDQIAAAIAVS